MNEKTRRLRRESLDLRPSISSERAELLTDFYQEHSGRHSVPVMRALSFYHLCQNKTLYLGEEELIVGERGPRPKAVPTYPELNCHSLEDLEILDSRPKTSYQVPERCLEAYESKVIPYWQGRSMRDRIFANLAAEWHEAYEAGMYTEFMEQRAPGHTVLDDKIYTKGMLDFKGDIAESLASLDFAEDPQAQEKREALRAMDVACDAVILFAERHAELAENRAAVEEDPRRRAELEKIARRVPAGPGRGAAGFPRSSAVLLVLSSGCHYRAQRLGCLQPGAPGSAPSAVFRERPGRRKSDARVGSRAIGSLLRQVQQPSGTAQGRRHRRREWDLHRFRQHQHRRPSAGRLRRLE